MKNVCQQSKKIEEVKRSISKRHCANAEGNTTGNRSWENGRTESSNMTLVEIADYFKVSVDYLLGRTDNPNVLKG